MALYLEKESEESVVVTYHRITEINNKTNERTLIQLYSYTTKEVRERQAYSEEIERRMNEGEDVTEEEYQAFIKGSKVYKSLTWYDLPYTQDFTVVDGYEYLKTLPEFEGAIDC